MLYTDNRRYNYNSKSNRFTITDLQNPEAIDEYMEAYTELYNMCDRLNCHTIPTPDKMLQNIQEHLTKGDSPGIYINLTLRDFPGFSKKFTQNSVTNLTFQLCVANEIEQAPPVSTPTLGNVFGSLPSSFQVGSNTFTQLINFVCREITYVPLTKPILYVVCELPHIDRTSLTGSMAGVVSTANVRLPLSALFGTHVKEFNGKFNIDIFKQYLNEYECELKRELDMDKDLKYAVADTKKNGKTYKDKIKELHIALANEKDKKKAHEMRKEIKEYRAKYEELLSKHLDVIQRKYNLKKDFD